MDFSRMNRFQEAMIDINQIYALTTVLCDLKFDKLNEEEFRALRSRATELKIASAALDRKFNGDLPRQVNKKQASLY